MRSLASLAILGSLGLSLGSSGALYAQSLAEHAAAAAGATIGTAAGKPLSNALGKVFGDVDNSAATAAGTKPAKKPAAPKAAEKTADKTADKESETKPIPDSEKVSRVGTPNPPPSASAGGSTSGGGGGGGSAAVASHPTSRPVKTRQPAPEPEQPVAAEPVAAAPPAPPVKELSPADLSSLHVGASEREMVAALGVPESRVSIPDDDGHLRETCQYWSQGRQVGTVRLDNGQVVQVVVRNQ
jgi:hypothetical protein